LSSLLKIGEFSQISQVPIKTLRYYDEIGLFCPACTDSETGYRYYSVEQLARVHQIMALKDIGLSLEQITALINENLSTEQIRGMLRLKKSEIQEQVQDAERALSLVEFRLRMIEAEDNFPELPVVLKPLESLQVLSIFVEQPRHKKHHMIQAIKEAVNKGLIKHTGLIIDAFHGETILPLESPELQDNQHEILLGVTSSQESIHLDGIGEFSIRDEPAIKNAATIILTGGDRIKNFEKMALLQRWTILHGYQPLAYVRYVHHMSEFHTDNREELVIEAQLALADDN
jgi:DNA-binding transcriptional MerR regulator